MLGLTCISINRTPILSCLKNHNSDPNPKPRINIAVPPPSVPPENQQRLKQKPSVVEIERAIGAGVFRDRDINRESEQEKTFFDTILDNTIGRTEGDVEKKLREAGEWISDRTEGSPSTGKNILMAVYLWILPLWILSFLVASGLVKLPFSIPFLDDLIM